jgi:hypothetical protein
MRHWHPRSFYYGINKRVIDYISSTSIVVFWGHLEEDAAVCLANLVHS